MPISSTDLPMGIGGEFVDVFGGQAPLLGADDMQDVPLAHIVRNTVKSAAGSQPKPVAPVSTFPPLHHLPSFTTPVKPCGLAVRVDSPEAVTHTTMGIPVTHTVYEVETQSTPSSFP
jgi:hypothetical protein